MQDFHQLDIWKKAHALVLRTDTVSQQLPPSKNFGLTLHLRRTAVSIAQSIAKRSGRDDSSEFAAELKKSRPASRDLAFITEQIHHELTDELIEIRKISRGLIKRISGSAEPLR